MGESCTKIGSGATPKGGSTVYTSNGTSFIRSQNVYNLRFDYNGLTHINDEAAEKLKNVSVIENDILLNITGDSVQEPASCQIRYYRQGLISMWQLLELIMNY